MPGAPAISTTCGGLNGLPLFFAYKGPLESTFQMCHYITATVSNKDNIESVASIFKAHGFGFEFISNPYVAQQIGLQDWYILTSGKYCDCGTALGSLSNRVRAKAVDSERHVAKLRKQGWGEAKIKRWLEQKEQQRATLTRGRGACEGWCP